MTQESPTTVSEANARLIAAAPDLLAVCERIDALRKVEGGIGDALGGLGDWLEDVIAKAKGAERGA